MKKFLVLFLITTSLFACNERENEKSTDVKTIYDSASKVNVIVVKDDNGNDLLMDYLVYQSLLNTYHSPYAARNYYVSHYDSYRNTAPRTIVNNNYHYNTNVSNSTNISKPNVSVPSVSKPNVSVPNSSIDASRLKSNTPTATAKPKGRPENVGSWFRSSTKSVPTTQSTQTSTPSKSSNIGSWFRSSSNSNSNPKPNSSITRNSSRSASSPRSFSRPSSRR